jgi:hypothetical protein
MKDMARIALGVLALALLLGNSGCTWTETYDEYPPDVARVHPAHHAGHVHPAPPGE